MSYWHTRDITLRLIADRKARTELPEANSAIDSLLEQLPEHLVFAIADCLNGNEMLTQVPRDFEE